MTSSTPFFDIDVCGHAQYAILFLYFTKELQQQQRKSDQMLHYHLNTLYNVKLLLWEHFYEQYMFIWYEVTSSFHKALSYIGTR